MNILDTYDLRTPATIKALAYVEERLAECRAMNDNLQDADKTAFLRGRIAELKHIKDLLATGAS